MGTIGRLAVVIAVALSFLLTTLQPAQAKNDPPPVKSAPAPVHTVVSHPVNIPRPAPQVHQQPAHQTFSNHVTPQHANTVQQRPWRDHAGSVQRYNSGRATFHGTPMFHGTPARVMRAAVNQRIMVARNVPADRRRVFLERGRWEHYPWWRSTPLVVTAWGPWAYPVYVTPGYYVMYFPVNEAIPVSFGVADADGNASVDVQGPGRVFVVRKEESGDFSFIEGQEIGLADDVNTQVDGGASEAAPSSADGGSRELPTQEEKPITPAGNGGFDQ